VQYDIKRVLAYSTVSQLGYMFTAMGVGAFSAGAFHLMTHAFFKALLFLGSGSVIHAMAGEQDMRRMGALRPHLPLTFATMGIGALALAGIPPLAGFFSKDEILFRTFGASKVLWIVALVTAFMTAFYMFRLIAMTFLGSYRGPAWERNSHGASDAHAAGDHAAWHGPHEAPRAMTVPLLLLAAGTVLAGVVGIPAALGGGNAIERFLEPSFTVAGVQPGSLPEAGTDAGEEHSSRAVELGLMALSVLVAAGGIGLARRLYVTDRSASERAARRFAGLHRLLSHKYYVDELYNATVVAFTGVAARGLWTFDRRVVDGFVNGSGWATLLGSWMSGLTDRAVVDGIVNGLGTRIQRASYSMRHLQTGLVQNYALLMLFGVFAFASLYLFVR